MKLSDGFDARRLRPSGPRYWRLRLGAGLAAVCATVGVLLAMAGAATLLGRPPAVGTLNESPGAGAVVLGLGLVLLWAGILVWRLCRRRLRRPSDLSLSPGLMKKRD
ncbi:MAG: hypothetical protein KJ884_09145 [Gammaproteobacteria bacterium]|nr:hypothetical protein [Gammaproteobacteria bacterium]MBU1492024.1 hypothetical protein [Gammaproteobacteria bacterium]MBU2065930.1 hypothetical protein [Gammaproteobacteria bacterium]MBU2141256.1 hypothetical protein [Gammaproteobacteria bacterium]MBU2215356.1 hypothetical protein [Gammaproteobacteria bacterium]